MLGIVLLPVLVVGVVSIPAMQTVIVHQVAGYLSDELQADVQIESLRVRYSGNIQLTGFSIQSPAGEQLASFQSFEVKINKIRRKEKQINLGLLRLKDVQVNYHQLDSSSSNMDFLFDYFQSDAPSQESFDLYCDRFEIIESGLSYQNTVSDSLIRYDVNQLQLFASALLLTNDSAGVRINELAFLSPQLIDLHHLAVDIGYSLHHIAFNDLKVQTASSRLNLSLDLRMDSDAGFSAPSFHDLYVRSSLEEFVIVPHEFYHIYAPLQGLNDTVRMSGTLKGDVQQLYFDDFSLQALPYASFQGEGGIRNLQQLDSAFFDLNIIESMINPVKIAGIYRHFTGQEFTLPEQVKNLGIVSVEGVIQGQSDDFSADAIFQTSSGDIITDLAINWSDYKQHYSYKGSLTARNFDLGKVMGSDVFGVVGLSATLDGAGLDKYATAQLNTLIDSAMINKRWYRNVQISGTYDQMTFDGEFNVQSPRLTLQAFGQADFSDKIPDFTASIDIPYADLKAIGLLDPDSESNPVFSTSVKMNLSGNDINTLGGWLTASDTRWKEGEEQVVMDELEVIVADSTTHNRHHIQLNSDYFNADIGGKFDVATLLSDLRFVLKNKLPFFEQQSESYQKQGHYVDFNLKVKDVSSLTGFFAPGIHLASNALLKGKLDVDQQKLYFQGGLESIKAGMFNIQNLRWQNLSDKSIGLVLTADRIQIDDTLGINDFSFTTHAFHDSLPFVMSWDEPDLAEVQKSKISGAFYLNDLPLKKLRFNHSWFTTNDTLWEIDHNSSVYLDTAFVQINDFKLGNPQQSLSIDGILSADSTHQMTVKFDRLNVSNIDPFTHSRRIDFDGKISGVLKARNVFSQHPSFTTDITVDSIGFNHEHLGDAVIQSGWVDSLNALFAKVEIRYTGNIGSTYPLKVDGYFYPYRDSENFDFDMELKHFKLQAIAGYLRSFTSDFRGLASGEMQFKGSLQDPQLTGQLRLQRTYMHIDFLNTSYSFTDSVNFYSNRIVFNNVKVNDNNSSATKGNHAFLNGEIRHDNFKEIEVDLNIDAENFTVLNTSYADNDMFYGSAIATGKVDIYGPTHDISMDVIAKTESGTRIFLPLSGSTEASSSDFITFISSETDTVNEVAFQPKRRENVKGIRMNIDLEVTRNAEVQIIFDESVGDVLRARGAGQLELNVDTRGDFSMYGNYTVSEGDYLFTLENIINKPFDLKEGGTITWAGDPFDARLNVDAVYKTDARLYDLISYIDSSDVYKKSRPVHCIIHLEGNLANPEIVPDIELPQADEITRQLLRTVLYVNQNQVNQQEMNRQFVGLLVLNSFFPPADLTGASGGANIDYAGLGITNSTDILTNQLGNWLSQISDVNVGVNYRSGDDISTEQLEVALSTQLFDDKVSISTNVGVGGNEVSEQAAQSEETSNIVGDVNVEYTINDKIKLRAFNQHNSSSYLEEKGPYTQGVGVFYRKEFDKFSELFNRQKEKEEKEKQKNSTNPTNGTSSDQKEKK